MGISQYAFARQVGMTPQGVAKAVKTGRLTLESDGTVDPARGAIQLEQSTRKGWGGRREPRPKVAADAESPSATTFSAAQLRKELALAVSYELRNAKVRAGLLDAAVAMQMWRSAVDQTRAILLRIPMTAAPALRAAAQVGEHAVTAKLTVIIHDALTELANLPVEDGGEGGFRQSAQARSQ